ncbi:MAG: DNA polymerase III subunit alpha [Chlamydiales bacterium]|nr:DNA polymerase III subunit alpha [Chlamydiales bacterium]
MSWISLHNHSQFSILDAAASIEKLVERAALFGMPAVALTDSGNMFGAVDFYKACKAKKIKSLIGCELHVAPSSRLEKKRIHGQFSGYPLVLLAKDHLGYRNLCRLTSLAYLEGFYYTPRIDKQLLKECAEGLICLSGPHRSSIAQLILHEKEEELVAEIAWFQNLFGEDYYFELLRHEMTQEKIRADGMDQEGWLHQRYLDYIAGQKKVNARLVELACQYQIRCVAANDSRYLDRDDWRAHEILMNIQSGEPCEIWEKDSFGNLKAKVLNPKREAALTHELDFKSQEQMQSLFADLPEALENTLLVAEKCQFEFDLKSKYYPVFIPPSLENTSFSKKERKIAAEKFLRQLCEEGIPQRYSLERLSKVQEKYPGKDPLEVVKERLAYELDVIIPKGMGDYLLIVWDFIAWAKRNQIPMGPGRGSGAGSIVLYLIGITDIEPLQFNLFFERFINPERISYPDIDVDICMDRRSEVIDYTVGKYGKDKVAHILLLYY